jgi:hypothetical protein
VTARTQITLDPEIQRQARKRAADLGCSLAEYLRRLVARDLGLPRAKPDVSSIFNLFNSGGSNIARDKDEMIGQALDALHPRRPRKTRKRA